MIHSGQIMGNDQLVSLLFLPGVSTAEQVTDVSGRGVGMDVVRREIHNAGGRIEVETTAGKGTTFRVILPRSVHTQIIEGFVVRSGTGSYLFPLPLVGEVFPMTPELAHSIPGRGEVISRLDTILPLLRLDHALHTAGVASNEKSERDCGTVVVLQLEGGRLALLADEVLGIRKTVVKDLGEVGSDAKVFEGVGMMGDGSMSLILGANGIASLTKEAMLAV
jgi:two-component system chemotaxis sensor kinase CheA